MSDTEKLDDAYWHERIKLLMQKFGMPESIQLYLLFNQLKNEMQQAYAAPAPSERKPDFWYRDKQGMLTLIDHEPGAEYGSGWTPLYRA